jgi:hypothetical protein
MPRKSASANSFTVVSSLEKHRRRISTPAHLSVDERLLFEALVNDCVPNQFTESDSPMLVAYVQSILLSRIAFEAAMESPSELPAWEKTARTMATLSSKLRLNPHARTDPTTLSRRLERMKNSERSWAPRVAPQ